MRINILYSCVLMSCPYTSRAKLYDIILGRPVAACALKAKLIRYHIIV